MGAGVRARSRLVADVGTTTVSLALLDRAGRVVRRRELPNPQQCTGADVLSRIAAERAARSAGLVDVLRRVADEWGADPRQEVVAVANTVMAHFLLGKSPSGLGYHPYRSRLSRRRVLRAVRAGLRLVMPPLLGRFVGSDCCAAILASGIHRSRRLALLVDAGTNGEVALGDRNGILVCSTAAGPAFEGATLECGSLAGPGAVRSVSISDGRIQVHVGGRRQPESICGSGVLDAVAAGLKFGKIDRSGRVAGGRLQLAPRVWLSQADIREVQLAVGAVGAAVRLLLRSRGADTKDIRQVVVTGRFGAALNIESAVAVGLLPETTASVRQHGNLALRGAVMVAREPELMAEAEALAGKCREVMLSGRQDFESVFVEQMEFRRWR
uniref:DUF4445 domain-containing protein n=1 Tax=candidate division WOR-3 bacterium TaxID=2052148 RepID=A0A7C4GGH7_UNCW3